MTTVAGKRGRTASRVAAVIAAYALLLQAFFAGAVAVSTKAVGHDEATYVLCLGAGGSESPTLQHPGKVHCVLCAVGAQARAIDVTPAALPVVYGEGRIVAWPFDGEQRPAISEFFQHRTRGPPTA